MMIHDDKRLNQMLDIPVSPVDFPTAAHVTYIYAAGLYSAQRSYTIYIPYKKQVIILVEGIVEPQPSGIGGTKTRVYRSLPLPDV